MIEPETSLHIESKPWGTSLCLQSNPLFQIFRIEGKKGGFSSHHRHRTKYNRFYVESGKLLVIVWKHDEVEPYEYCLGKGDSLTVEIGDWHQFHVLEDNTVAFETYWVLMQSEDIQRTTEGGMAKSDPLEAMPKWKRDYLTAYFTNRDYNVAWDD